MGNSNSVQNQFRNALKSEDKKKVHKLLKDKNNKLDLKKINGLEYDETVLIYAIVNNNFEEDIIIEILSHSSIYNNIEYINKCNNMIDNTALHYAVIGGYIQVIRQILSISSDCWKIKNKNDQTPIMSAIATDKGSSIAVLLDSSTTDSSVIKQEINERYLSPSFFEDFFENIRKINPSSETLNWFMSHPKLEFRDQNLFISYLRYFPPPIDFDFIKKFTTIENLCICLYPLNPWSCLSTFQSLIELDQEIKNEDWSSSSERGRENLWLSLKCVIRSSSTHSTEIIKWILIQLDGKIKENEKVYVYEMFRNLIYGTNILDSLLYPVITTVPSLKEIASNFVVKRGIKYNSTTLVIDIIELLEDPKNWIKEDDKYHLTFLYEGWRRVKDEIDARLSVLIEGLGGVEVMKKIIMNKERLEELFNPLYYDSLQLPITFSLLIHKYKIIDIEEVKKLIGEEKVKKYLKQCEKKSPYFMDIKTIFGI